MKPQPQPPLNWPPPRRRSPPCASEPTTASATTKAPVNRDAKPQRSGALTEFPTPNRCWHIAINRRERSHFRVARPKRPAMGASTCSRAEPKTRLCPVDHQTRSQRLNDHPPRKVTAQQTQIEANQTEQEPTEETEFECSPFPRLAPVLFASEMPENFSRFLSGSATAPR